MSFIAIILFFIVYLANAQIQSFSLNENYVFKDSNNIAIDLANSGGFQSVYLQVLDLDQNNKLELLFTSLDIGLLHAFEQKSENSLDFVQKENFKIDIKIARWFHLIDFNNDGILDLLTLDDFDVIGYRMNHGSNLRPEYSEFTRLKDQNSNFIIPELGNIPVMYDFNKRGKKDLFLSTQSQGNIIHFENISDSVAVFKHITNNFANVSVLGRAKKHGRSSFAFIDLDRDNDTDILWGDQFQDYFYFVENITNDTNPVYDYDINEDYTGGDAFESLFTYNLPIITDLNNDAKLDIIMLPQTDPRNNIQLYLGKDSLFKFELYSKELIKTIDYGYNSSVKLYDINQDGHLDIHIASSSNSHGFFEINTFIKNESLKEYRNEKLIKNYPWKNDNITANDFQIVDINLDSKWDIVFVDENGDLYQSLNVGTINEAEFSSYTKLLSGLGNFTQFRILDLDSDNDFDLICTQVLGNFFIYKTDLSLFDTKINLTTLSNLSDHLVTFDQLSSNDFILFDNQNSSYQEFRINNEFDVELTNAGVLELPYLGRNSNLAILNTSEVEKDFIFGNNNGGLLIYQINFESDEDKSDELIIFPNPFKNNFTVRSPKNENIKSIKVYNILGKLIINDNFSEAKETINISLKKQSSAVYFILIESNKNIYRRKIVHVNN